MKIQSITVSNNTNVVEVTYTLNNRREKNLKLITVIKQEYKLDKKRLIAINNNNKYNIPFCERDKANKLIKKVKTTFFKHKQNENTSSSKKKQKKLKKTITIEFDIEDNQDQENIEF
ncbi:hypothetical protein Glove_241g26 [Diversispora epigaea]|uniref:Uncharacterized protein n=1 Tax=Diversispora epigaea TaxID=1348612 RepID=A0A397II33_9GLOM|nr:hypothetical protein Glove_241g26 [Diversispora epigaea]